MKAGGLRALWITPRRGRDLQIAELAARQHGCATRGQLRALGLGENAIVDGREVDAFFRGERVIVELDSCALCSDRSTFELDRRKDAEAAAKGLTTVRLTDERTGRELDQEAARLRQMLKDRRPRAA